MARLNDDVLLLIVDELAKHHDIHPQRPSRNDILARICRTSRSLAQVARRRLWQHVEISQGRQLEILKASCVVDGHGERTSRYTVRWSWTANAALADLVDVARWLPAVEDLRIHGSWTDLDMCSVEKHAHLRRLTLVGVRLSLSRPVFLPQLEELSIYNVSTHSSLPCRLLHPAALPALRAVRLTGFSDYQMHESFQLADILSPAMLAQLDCIQTDASAVDLDSALARGDSPPVLVELVSIPPILPRHALFQSSRAFFAGFDMPYASRPPPAVVPPDARTAFVAVFPRALDASRDAALAIEDFQAACKVRGHEVVDGGEVPGDSLDALSPGFWRWARARKAAQAAARRREDAST
ncbi:hypothetical protein JCM8208_004664 [Rhodotorula glutinis]